MNKRLKSILAMILVGGILTGIYFLFKWRWHLMLFIWIESFFIVKLIHAPKWRSLEPLLWILLIIAGILIYGYIFILTQYKIQ